MSRETRLVAILFAVSIVGVTALSFMADQYRKRLAPGAATGSASPRESEAARALRPDVPPGSVPEASGARAAREVAGFLAARDAVQEVCARAEGRCTESDTGVVATYRTRRQGALAAHRMSYADYVAARSAWRAWSASEPGGDPALTAAFETQRGAAEKAGLGPLESLDDAVK